MEYIPRIIENLVRSSLFKSKAIVLFGPRQSGKTTLLKNIFSGNQAEVLWLNGDSPDVRQHLADMTLAKWQLVLGKNRVVIVDEAQRIPEIGLAVKLLVDERPDIQPIITGSSSIELAGFTNEPLTGRKYEFLLLPLSFRELTLHRGFIAEQSMLEHRLLFGAYPEVVTTPGDEEKLLSLLSGSYLYKDILMLESVKRPALLDKLLRALALQLGSEVSASELSRLIGADVKTVNRYLDLLEKSYVIFTLPAFSRNARAEIRKGRKFYFYDLGIRNAILGNFLPYHARTDIGGVWENYLIVERLKNQCNMPFPPRRYFWRTTEQNEVDYLEESSEGLAAWEFKWNPKTIAKIPAAFTSAYPEAKTALISQANYEKFLGAES